MEWATLHGVSSLWLEVFWQMSVFWWCCWGPWGPCLNANTALVHLEWRLLSSAFLRRSQMMLTQWPSALFPSLRPWFLWNRYMSSPTWIPFPFTSKCDPIATICEERPLGNLPNEAKVPKECHIVIVPHGGTEGINTLWSLFLIKSYEDYCSLSWNTDYIFAQMENEEHL